MTAQNVGTVKGRRLLTLCVGLAAMVGAAVLVAFLVARSASVDAGPLSVGDPTATAVSSEPVGKVVAVGVMEVMNPTKQAAVLQSFALVFRKGQARPQLVKTRVALRGRDYRFNQAYSRGCPPPGYRRLFPLRGFRIPPGQTASLVFGLRLPRAGRFGLRSVDLVYSVGGAGHRVLLPDAVNLCSDASCPLPPNPMQ